MAGRGKNRYVSHADSWDNYFEANNDEYHGGFTRGILDLNRIFDGEPLEALALAYLDPDEAHLIQSMYMRAVLQMNHPEMREHYKDVLGAGEGGNGCRNGSSPGSKKKSIELSKLPFYMQVVLSKVAVSNAIHGKGQQRRVDMHTGYNSAIAMARAQAASPEEMYRRSAANLDPDHAREQERNGR